MNSPIPFILIVCLTSCYQKETLPDGPVSTLIPTDSTDISSLGLFSLSSLAMTDSAIFLSSGQSKTLIKTTHEFNPLSKYDVQGRGPFELGDASEIAITDQHVYVIDFSQRKLIEFTHDLVPVDEFLVEKPPFSIVSIHDRSLWMGSFDMAREDLYLLDFGSKSTSPVGELVKTKNPMEGLVFHAKNDRGDILRYRQFHHRLDLFHPDGTHHSFINPLHPERPEVDASVPGYPVFNSKIHHSAFLTRELACVLSGDHTPGNQPVQCFDFKGTLVARYRLAQDPSMISVYADSTLYTYSSKTNHIYVYNLGF